MCQIKKKKKESKKKEKEKIKKKTEIYQSICFLWLIVNVEASMCCTRQCESAK